jgi:hypothetical protein
MKNETYAYFAIVGTGDHNRITKILEVEPTAAFTQGTKIPGRDTFYGATRWKLESRIDRNRPLQECLEEHVEDVVSMIEKFKDKLPLLKPDYDTIIQCVAYYNGSNLGCNLPSELIQRIADLGLGIDFDLYSHPDDEDDA